MLKKKKKRKIQIERAGGQAGNTKSQLHRRGMCSMRKNWHRTYSDVVGVFAVADAICALY